MSKIQADVQLMTMPNFLTVKCLGQETKVDAGELSQEDAAGLWDHWKTFWLAHVAKRAKALNGRE